ARLVELRVGDLVIRSHTLFKTRGLTSGDGSDVAQSRHARLRSDRRLGHSDCAQDLDLMPGHGSDHSSPFPGKRLAAASPGWGVTSEPVWTGQNFRKGSGQNFWNPQQRSSSSSPLPAQRAVENGLSAI